MAMNEFEHTLTNIVERHGVSMDDLAKQARYDPLFFRNVVSGKSRQMPVDFFVRVADVLDLSAEEKDALVRSWAFGVERWN
jgi:hypothetical protein